MSYTLANGTLLSQTDGLGTTSYLLGDAQNSTRMLTDSSGGITDNYSYDAFGNLQNSPASLSTNYLYTGQQYDPITELYSLRARYYDPSVGRFLSRDTWPYDYQNPVELNRYVYAMNNPLMYADPSGHSGMVGNAFNYIKSKIISEGFRSGIVYPFVDGFLAGFLGHVIGSLLYNYIVDEPFEIDSYNFGEAMLASFSGGMLGIYNAWVGRVTSTRRHKYAIGLGFQYASGVGPFERLC